PARRREPTGAPSESLDVEAEAARNPVEPFQPNLAGAPSEPPSGIERPLRDLEEMDGGSVSDVVDRTPFPRLVRGEPEQRRDGVANVQEVEKLIGTADHDGFTPNTSGREQMRHFRPTEALRGPVEPRQPDAGDTAGRRGFLEQSRQLLGSQLRHAVGSFRSGGKILRPRERMRESIDGLTRHHHEAWEIDASRG